MAQGKQTTRTDADVLVVGGGLAGLQAAATVRAHGLVPLVIEAGHELGGRARSGRAGSVAFDFGGEWFGRRHVRLTALAWRFNLEVQPAGQLGHPVLWRLGERESVGRLPPLVMAGDLLRSIWRARKLAAGVDPVSPWRSPCAEELDAISVRTWLDREGVGEEPKALLGALIGALSSAPIEEVSLLHLLWWISRGSGPVASIMTTFQWRFADGAQAVANRLGALLDPRPVLGETVTGIEQNGIVRVETDRGGSYSARRAIVTASASALPSIEFDPPLPAHLRRLAELRIDPGTKVIALLPAGHRCPQRLVLGRRTLWAAWRAGERVTGFSPPPESELPAEELARDLADCFGVAASDLRGTTVHRWSEQQAIPGCDVAFAPSQLTTHGPHLREAHGLVGFAGVERSSWPNNMEGALESGERAGLEAALSA